MKSGLASKDILKMVEIIKKSNVEYKHPVFVCPHCNEVFEDYLFEEHITKLLNEDSHEKP